MLNIQLMSEEELAVLTGERIANTDEEISIISAMLVDFRRYSLEIERDSQKLIYDFRIKESIYQRGDVVSVKFKNSSGTLVEIAQCVITSLVADKLHPFYFPEHPEHFRKIGVILHKINAHGTLQKKPFQVTPSHILHIIGRIKAEQIEEELGDQPSESESHEKHE